MFNFLKKPKEKCSVLISTCDAYADTWEPFFALLKKYWADIPFDIYFNTETKPCTCSDFKVNSILCEDKSLTWSARLKKALNQIDSKYIIFLLDDFFLDDYVETDELLNCIGYMQKDKKIASFTFVTTGEQTQSLKTPRYSLKWQMSKYKITAVNALWNKEKLLSYLNDSENAWEFEKNGTLRSYTRDDKFYDLSVGQKSPLQVQFGKYGLFSGKWLKDTIALFEQHNISMDFSKRGFYDERLRGLSNSIRAVFDLDSHVIANYNLKNPNNKPIMCPNPVKQGDFQQVYNLHGALNVIRWEPSTSWGFGIKNLKFVIEYADKTKEKVESENFYGNFIIGDDTFVFNQAPPYVIVFAECRKEIENFYVTGTLVFVDDISLLIEASTCPLKKEITEQQTLFENIFYNEYITMKEKMVHWFLNSSLCQYPKVGSNLTKLTQKSPVGNTHGKFEYYYKIDPQYSNKVEWKIADYNGVVVKNFKIILHYDNNKNVIFSICDNLDSSNQFFVVKRYSSFIEKSTVAFLLPENKPVAITIKGDVLCPVSINVLKKFIYLG